MVIKEFITFHMNQVKLLIITKKIIIYITSDKNFVYNSRGTGLTEQRNSNARSRMIFIPRCRLQSTNFTRQSFYTFAKSLKKKLQNTVNTDLADDDVYKFINFATLTQRIISCFSPLFLYALLQHNMFSFRQTLEQSV